MKMTEASSKIEVRTTCRPDGVFHAFVIEKRDKRGENERQQNVHPVHGVAADLVERELRRAIGNQIAQDFTYGNRLEGGKPTNTRTPKTSRLRRIRPSQNLCRRRPLRRPPAAASA